ncbi:MAG TPA: serine/threonine-protein kinase [Stenomitos sp.]
MVPQDPRFPAPFLPQGMPQVPGGMRSGPLPPGGLMPGRMPEMPQGPMFHPGIPLPNGTLLADRFEISDMLFEGRCGFIYVTRDRKAQGAMRLVKTFDPRRGDGKDEDLFRRESSILMSLDHPRIPKGYGILDHDGMLCAPQAYTPGEELARYLHTRGKLPEAEVVAIMEQLLDILAYCHERKPSVLHRDLKPENLLRDQEGTLFLVDFGSASDRHQDKQRVPLENLTTMQTLGYAAPEQVYGLEAYPASDLYAVGAMAVHLLTGKHPIYLYDGMTGRLEWEAPVSEHLRRWIESMLEIPVARRLQNAREALRRLKRE